MYTPTSFDQPDIQALHKRMRDHPLATLVTQGKLAATQRVLAIVKF
ncbi:hypothetical protein GALL_407780 [mine drainage metagenome]|uniref:Uncharacterized protein n=1 Tax=mine drainage metagenome TaxID=410659 RepID=A0A1J5QC21_9ZZZZ